MARLLEKISTQMKNHAEWWADYMTEMSILVISLAATFYGENLIEGYNEAQEDKTTMEMVINELEYNAEVLADMKQQYQAEVHFSKILKRALVQHETFPQDTIDTYKNFHRMYYYISLKMNAFDFIKVSGTMQRMDDKQLSVQLFECYELLNILKELDARFREERRVKLSNFTSQLEGGEHGVTAREQWKQIDADAAFKRYLLYSAPSLAVAVNAQIDAAVESISRTVGMIRSGYGISEAQ